MTNKSPITQELFSTWEKLSRETSKLESQIEKRIDYIVRTVYKTFNNKLSTWYFYGAGEGEMGNMKLAIDKDSFYIIVELERDRDGRYNSKEMVILLKDGSEWELEGEYPARWLFEDFEEELIQGKKKFEEKLEEKAKKKKEHALAQKQKKLALAESAKAKLTKEELKALKSL